MTQMKLFDTDATVGQLSLFPDVVQEVRAATPLPHERMNIPAAPTGTAVAPFDPKNWQAAYELDTDKFSKAPYVVKLLRRHQEAWDYKICIPREALDVAVLAGNYGRFDTPEAALAAARRAGWLPLPHAEATAVIDQVHGKLHHTVEFAELPYSVSILGAEGSIKNQQNAHKLIDAAVLTAVGLLSSEIFGD